MPNLNEMYPSACHSICDAINRLKGHEAKLGDNSWSGYPRGVIVDGNYIEFDLKDQQRMKDNIRWDIHVWNPITRKTKRFPGQKNVFAHDYNNVAEVFIQIAAHYAEVKAENLARKSAEEVVYKLEKLYCPLPPDQMAMRREHDPDCGHREMGTVPYFTGSGNAKYPLFMRFSIEGNFTEEEIHTIMARLEGAGLLNKSTDEIAKIDQDA